MGKQDVRGVGGQSINEKWQAGPRTNFGLMIDGFPNMFMIVGPHAPFANVPPLVEAGSHWMGKAIAHARAAGSDYFVATPESVQAWGEKIQMLLDATLLGGATEQHSWFKGANVPGKVQAPLFYFGGATAYFDELQSSAENGFPGFDTQRARATQPA